MNNALRKLPSLLFSFFLLTGILKAQEGLRPLQTNINYFYPELEASFGGKTNSPLALKGSSGSLFLPFKDDFSYAPLNKYADQRLWADSGVYINWGYGIAPPSIGVATFDGLNRNGFPYAPNLVNVNQPYASDTLTSRAINLLTTPSSQTLQPSDSIALTFYYQARGRGEAPEVGDSLIVDLFKPAQNSWQTTAWFAKGNINPNINDTVFKRAFVRLSDTAFLHDGFKFRFRNKANISGDYDHWHVDYVYIDKNRDSKADTIYNDLTFAGLPGSLLKEYSAMPYEQYQTTEMALRNSVRIKNNGAFAINHIYENRIYDQTGTQLNLYQGGPTNLCPFITTTCSTHGYSTYQPHANPAFNYTFNPLNDSADFSIKHYLALTGASGDFIRENDTVVQYQRFRNYYAYDDGSAEGGYFVNGAASKMALKFRVNVNDTLRGVRIYFDPVGNIDLVESSYKFKIKLWADAGNQPGAEIYSENATVPKYFKTGYKELPEYTFSKMQFLNPGTYYIGFEQQVAAGITVGFDKNYDNHNFLYYNTGSGWAQSTLPGSLMLRPVMGKAVPKPVGLSSASPRLEWNLYPNPAKNEVTVSVEDFDVNYSIDIRNLLGQNVYRQGGLQGPQTLYLSDLPDGLYILNINTAAGLTATKKLLIQH